MSGTADEPEYLNVRETAKRLAVHPNTVRNWARDGLLPSARLPGSRFHRFDARDVERLRRQRGSVIASLEAERRAIGPELVDATQLSQWAATRAAQGLFPQLVRRLLASTPGISNLSIRSGEGVSVAGWDGRAESDGSSPYLPRGLLCLELGVGRNPKEKAQADYEKRTANPLGENPRAATFVFVTPRRWSGADEWASERRREGVWSDVRVLDADDVEGWLEAAPAVHYWISEQLGRRPSAAVTLGKWWQRFESRTEPPLPLSLFLAGRENERDDLMRFLRGTPDVIGVQASWRDEAIAFVYAAIDSQNDHEGQSVPPPLVVFSPAAWEGVLVEPGRMTLLPTFDDPDLASARAAGHHVVVPFGREHLARHTTIELRRPDRHAAAEALEQAGLDRDRADRLAALARRNMAALVRSLARDPNLARPPWSGGPTADVLAPLTLIGAWTESDVDRAAVSRIADSEWRSIERELTRWRETEDPPFVRPGGQWHLASAEEAFMVLRGSLSPDALKRWRDVVPAVLQERDPAAGPRAGEPSAADLRDVTHVYSPTVRRGMAEGIALVGGLGNELLNDGLSGADHARRMVGALLAAADSDNSGRSWQSLADQLPRLAEAAPETFLDAVHDSLDRDPGILRSLFQDRDRDTWLYTSSPHTGLLWALETVCWSGDYLVPAIRALARLDAIDPGGRLSNRPLESMQSILVPWIRHTSASFDVRTRAVRQVCRESPDVGWKLLLALWPQPNSVASPPSAPRFRDWRPDKRTVTVAEWAEFVGELVSLAMAVAASDVSKWAELVARIGPLPPAERNRMLDRLEEVARPEALQTDQRLRLWEAVRRVVSRHRRAPKANWSMDPELLARMSRIADRLEPTETVERFGYLFDWRPDLSDGPRENRAEYNAALAQLRAHAVRETLEVGSTEGLARLAQQSPATRHLGSTVADVTADDLASELLTWLDHVEDSRRTLAWSWAERRAGSQGVPWVAGMLARREAATASRRIALALTGPPGQELWDLIASTSHTLDAAYWEQVNPWAVGPTDAQYAARRLLDSGRPWPAIDLLAAHVDADARDESAIAPALVEAVLDAALQSDSGEATSQSLAYEVGRLLDYLAASQSNSASVMRFEWAFFSLLDDYREPRALFAALDEDPVFFVELVSRVYRGKRQQRRQLSEDDSALAHHSWWVLNHWRKLPGQRADGTIDADHLRAWVNAARLLLTDNDRADIGDEQIGQVLSASPPGGDGAWPAEPVREIIETIGSRSLETGLHVGVINARGITSRGLFDGGKQERALAADYLRWARETAGEWPRTSRVLRGIAEDYERDAQRHDIEAELTADTE
ncbi:MAG TPA: helix-turn-helix domain-containing protein [Solirubrobacteraceae bacterium]